MTVFFKINCTWYAALTRLDARQMAEMGVLLRDHIDHPFCGAIVYLRSEWGGISMNHGEELGVFSVEISFFKSSASSLSSFSQQALWTQY